jgi:uncharacterized protein (DUF1501 family)
MKPQPVLSRREFLRNSTVTGLGLATASATVPSFIARAALAPALPPREDRVLVVLQLSGGNDGLNTVVPFGDDAYYRERPVIGIKPGNVLRVGGRYGDYLGFNPALKALMGLWENGQMAVINGVGYPNPNRSHFRSMEIWHTAADADRVEEIGWIGRYFDNACPGAAAPELALNLSQDMPQAMKGQGGIGVNLEEPADSLDFLSRTPMNAQVVPDKVRELAARARSSPANYPDTRFASGLQTIATMVAGGLGTRIYYHELSGFDTHANEPATHTRLWTELSEGLRAFFADLEHRGIADRVLVMSFSEFGRRVAENGSQGTDHGAAAPLFVWGRHVRGGIHGSHPSLTDLDHGDLKWTVDFRSVYATVLDRWIGASHKLVLGRQFPSLPFVV